MNSATPCASPLHVLRVWVQGIGLLAPGIANWPQGQAVLSGSAPYANTPTVLPTPEMLPSAERRRASRVVKLAMAVAAEAVAHAGQNAAELASVFTSSTGDGHNCHALCEALASSNREVSPTRFHNSVHNAASGYWSIATGATPAAQVLGAYDASFGAGLLEAMVQAHTAQAPILLVAGDSEYPPPLHAKRPIADTSALALVLSPTRGPHALAELRMPRRGALRDGDSTALAAVLNGANPALVAATAGMPPLLGLPLVAAMLRPAGQPAEVNVEYLPPQVLQLTVVPVAGAVHPVPANA